MSATAAPRALPTKEWFTPKEAAAWQGCSVESVYAKIRAGALPYKLHGTRTYRIARAALLELDRRAMTLPAHVDAPAVDVRSFVSLLRRCADLLEQGAA